VRSGHVVVVVTDCARTYSTETEIAHAGAQFSDWTELRTAGFPAFDVPPGEPPADHRTEAERDHDRARTLADLIGDQGALFPLRHFEPVTTTLKELLDYTEQQDELTARFAEHGRKWRAYLERLIAAAGNDLSMVWQEAHSRLPDADVRDQLSGARLHETAADRTAPVMV
jgi:hypothetical protein